MLNESLSNLHENLVAIEGLLTYPFIAEETRKQLEELKSILKERLLALLSQIDIPKIS
jgi:hypothetical protein